MKQTTLETVRRGRRRIKRAMVGSTLPGRILLAALVLGWISDLLFYQKAWGISAPLFVLLLLSALSLLARSKGIRSSRSNLWLIPLTCLFALAVAVRASPFLVFLNTVATLGLLGLVAHFHLAGRVQDLGLLGYPFLWLSVAANALIRPASLISVTVDLAEVRRRSRPTVVPVVKGSLLAAPLLLIFLGLLASADLVFASYVESALHLEFLPPIFRMLWRTTLILAIAWLLSGALAYSLLRGHGNGEQTLAERVSGQVRKGLRLGAIEAATILVLVDLLFASFIWVQLAYLFGGRANISLDGYTYAEYARRGFFELVAVSILSMVLVKGVNWLASVPTGRISVMLRSAGSAMIGLVLVMLLSAFYRLRLYEQSFGYTRLRLYVYVFMFWLALLFIWTLLSLWRSGRVLRTDALDYRNGAGHFALALMVASMGFLITLNAINPDAFIARQNLSRYRQTGKIDPYYLARLSTDAVPELVPVLESLPAAERQPLCAGLQRQYRKATTDGARQHWPSFHFAHWRARRLLVSPAWFDLCDAE